MLSLGSSRSHASSDSFEQSSSLGTSSSATDASSFGDAASVGGSSSSVFGADVFSQLFSGANNVAGQLAANSGNLTNTANGLFDSGMSFLSQLGELSGGGPVGAGEQYLTDVAGGAGDGLLSDQIGQLGKDLESFFTESVLPGISADSVGAGALGGGRDEVARGIAGRGLISEYAKGVIGLRGADADRRLGAATNLANLTASRRLDASTAGISALPGQLDLMNSGAYAALTPYAMLGQILGGPTVLTDSFSSSYDKSGSTSTSRASSRDESQSTGTSSSSSKSKSWNFGIGS